MLRDFQIAFSTFRTVNKSMVAWMKTLVGLMLISVACSVAAEPLAMVQQLQQPTWLERDGLRGPLYPTVELQTGDIVQTGATGKLLLKFAEGSDVEIGSNARVRIEQLSSQPGVELASSSGASDELVTGSQSLFRGVLNVLRGAFRFTTSAAGLGQQRSIDISVGEMATIGIRGTDVWGKAADNDGGNGDFVVLIEGTISVNRQGAASLTMDEPQTIYRAASGEQASIDSVNVDDLQRWAQETALGEGQGVLSHKGLYGVSLASMQRDDYARAAHAQFSRQGYAVYLFAIEKNLQNWQRLAVVGFVTKADADFFVD